MGHYSIKIVLILVILVAVAYTMEKANDPAMVDLGTTGSVVGTVSESVVPDLNLAEHKRRNTEVLRHGHSSGGGGGGSSEERR
uniref:Secreted protein n=1 Tax=Daphnia galeata TaxID=27404 RepID=A0A8J2RUM6_9CRUS|nr:unnamed protein product [Daphnia galeata]